MIVTQELLSRVATLYLEQNLTQRQVKEILGLTEYQFRQIKKEGGFQKIAPKQFKREVLQRVSIDEIEAFYSNHSFKETATFFSISEGNLKSLLMEYNITHTEEQKVEYRRKTCLDKYGETCVLLTKQIRDKCESPEVLAKGQETARQRRLEKYGVEYTWQIPGVLEKTRQTNLERYGTERGWASTEEGKAYTSALHSDPEYQARTNASKKKNHSFNSSKPEEGIYLQLVSIFGEEDVVRQYRDSIRYPFNCDFYIKSLDLFIELNLHWTHGTVPYVENDPVCNAKLKRWQDKGTEYYKTAIQVWTEKDVTKINTARKNNINYLVVYPKDEFILVGSVNITSLMRDAHNLGANGIMDGLRKNFIALPVDPPQKEEEEDNTNNNS